MEKERVRVGRLFFTNSFMLKLGQKKALRTVKNTVEEHNVPRKVKIL
ncbi:MAG: hypothetical protein ACJAYJ_001697 [Saprospiraceae bacterium]|jgi:hypothetical protein